MKMFTFILICIAFTAVSSSSAAAPLRASSHAATWHIDPANGDDANVGDEAAPFRTLMRAAKLVNPGDTVLARAGVYFEHVKLERGGTKEAPITFRAVDGPEKTIITGAHRALREGRLKWDRVEGGLWRVALPEEPATLLCDDLNLYRYPSLDELRAFTVNDVSGQKKPGPGPKHGYAYDNGHVYLRLHDSGKYGATDPNTRVMKASPARGAGSRGDEIDARTRANFSLSTPDAANVIFEGFTFESPGFCGVWVRHGSAVVRNCKFLGCRTGVRGWDRAEKKPRELSEDVIVEKCEFTEHPTYADVSEIILETIARPAAERAAMARFFWWHRKGGAYTSEIGLVTAAGKHRTIRDNYVHDTFDALSFMSLSWSEDCKICGNRFERLVDNAVEAENHAQRLRVHDNVIVDCFEPFSYQPLDKEPWPADIVFENNTVSFTREGSNLWSNPKLGWRPGCCKIYVLPDLTEIPGHLVFRDNLIWFPTGSLISVNQGALSLRGVRFDNNIIAVNLLGGTEDGALARHVEFHGNQVSSLREDGRVSMVTLTGNNGNLYDNAKALGIIEVNKNNGSLSIEQGSPAASSGAITGRRPRTN